MLYRIKHYVSSFENTYLQRFKNKRDYFKDLKIKEIIRKKKFEYCLRRVK